ncbi:4-hydroxy-3-methylbut-2-en-1-yl diphosphate synthase [PVC group bacterium (ex Bugula neritina AB1)]|nr:4-hydroxy-3-methylbut-2-en-1-yl diphosphate synthase [PVC group bacterium (ex Bugula neritina AB1)]
MRLPSHEVKIGDCALGGNQPVRIQSMTTTDTLDIQKTVEQSLRMVNAGCELVRITAPSLKHAEALKDIKKKLQSQGCFVPIIADIHFTPRAAEIAARLIEKVRINPGNYADRKAFQQVEYSDQEYQDEICRIHDRFSPLVKICKEYGTAMRIGTNHGSLSDRIMSRYGDTPKGMVESALEFVRICEDHGFDKIVLSMKASNTQVMVQAYRLLVKSLLQQGKIYPIHLGVTEAGDGVDGRLKSTVGIGTLLAEGIGDTVRVSLTEEPEFELPVARYIVDSFTSPFDDKGDQFLLKDIPTIQTRFKNPFFFKRRNSKKTLGLGGGKIPLILSKHEKADIQVTDSFGDKVLCVFKIENVSDFYPVYEKIVTMVRENDDRPVVLDVRPLKVREDRNLEKREQWQMTLAASLGGLLLDGFVDALWVNPLEEDIEDAMSLLQAARLRTVKTEYISCPSCGRTLFDLQKTTERVRSKTNHLKQLKIAVMGCIVNGPGEMADADYGYVGAGPGKITLYRKHNVVKKNIPFENAVDELVNLIKDDGEWVDPV